MERLFTYGTLQDPDVQMRLIKRHVPMTPARVYGFARHTDLSPYPVALPADADSFIDGLVMDVTREELAHITVYEGAGYNRIRVTLDNGEEAWIFRGSPKHFPDDAGQA